MTDTVAHVQARHVRRCAITLGPAGGILKTLAVAALNAQVAKRGDAIAEWIMGFRILTASGNFQVGNPDNTGYITITAASMLPYDCPATSGAADTDVEGNGVTLGVEVYYTGDPTVP